MRSLTILQLNDLHGYLAPHPEPFRLASNDRFRSGGGLARIAAIFNSIRREVDGALIALDNGDTFHGTMPAVRTEGEALLRPPRGDRRGVNVGAPARRRPPVARRRAVCTSEQRGSLVVDQNAGQWACSAAPEAPLSD